jgi:cytidylate kinase
MSTERFAINITGQAGSGKSSAVEHVSRTYDMPIFSPSNVIRGWAKQHDMALKDRAGYVSAHRAMLAENPDIMVDSALAVPGNRLCIDGLRVPAHARGLARRLRLYTIGLYCPVEVRFARVMADRAARQLRDDSHIETLEDFIFDERADNGNTSPTEPNVDVMLATADFAVHTDQPHDRVKAAIDHIITAKILPHH